MNISYKRSTSAPNSATIESGLITLPLDLDIFCPSDAKIMPWETRRAYGSVVGTASISYKNLFQNLEYNKCKVVCSIPPLYKSTGIQYFNFSGSPSDSLFFGSMYRRKYQELPAQFGIVSVSLMAGPPQFGQIVLTQLSIEASGDSPVCVGSYFSTYGNSSGNSFSSSGCHPHFSQLTIGIGSPQ